MEAAMRTLNWRLWRNMALLLVCAVLLTACGAFRSAPDGGPAPESAQKVVKTAYTQMGKKYRAGGASPQKGFDCSGYVQYVFKKHRAILPRTADLQYEKGLFVTQSQLKPGDLVFFSTYEPGASHVGIYAGNGKFWNATSSRGVMLCGLKDDYWHKHYYGAKRVLVS